MRNVPFLLVVCLAGFSSCKFLARQIIDHTDSWSSGMPKSRGTLTAGKQTGEWTFYYESGRPRAKGTYADDRMVGEWTFFYESGVIERAGAFDDTGKRTGEWTFQYPDQTPQARGRYVADAEDGPWTFYHPSGQVEREGQFDRGKLSGPWRYAYADGRPRAAGMYHRGRRIGRWQVWDSTGQSGTQDFGMPAGVEIALESGPAGALLRVGVLVDGRPEGRWTSYHDNGSLRFCCTLDNGVPGGVYEARDEAGRVLAQGVIAEGSFRSDRVDGAALVAELLRPVDAAALAAAAPPSPSPSPSPAPAAATAAVVAAIEAEPARVPAPVQVDFTVKQKREMQEYVREYTDGPRARGSMFDTYAPDVSRPRPRGQGERSELVGKPMPFQVLRGVDGRDLDLRDFRGRKRVMIVVLRGFLGEVCCYCVAQTKALAQQRERLEQLGIEVLVIYPGAKENEQSFQTAYRMTFDDEAPPYRVFYDPDLDLVSQLGIAGDLAFPTTLILDEQGIVQFAYVGEHRADRPAAKKLIQIIEGMQK